ncbi:MAG: 30S ribosomal protein S2 [Candidatus Susulua stagnicola]|nr:30S ribosomal protein S2 [Candidatus Susulua stagnicola]
MALPEIIKELLENGVHFGHLSKHWNPKMKRFIFGKKKNVYIIDLEKTAQKLEEAKEFAKQKAKDGEKILFVSTKKQLRGIVKEFASSCSMPYVSERWVGGLLTNFSTVRRRVDKYLEFLKKRETGGFDIMVKKEVVKINREIERMERSYSGVTSLKGLPGCVFVVDPKKEVACVREVNKLGIPVIALIDTDANPDIIDYPIPGNDDSIKSVKYITSCLIEAINQGLKEALDSKEKDETASAEEAEKDSSSEVKIEKKATEENIEKST